MTSKSANLATLKTLLFVQILPWLVIAFGSSVIVGLLLMRVMMPVITKGATPNPASVMVWYPIISMGLTCVLSLAKDAVFMVLARRKLYANFRDMAVRAIVPIQITVPPPAPRPAATPPVIPAQS